MLQSFYSVWRYNSGKIIVCHKKLEVLMFIKRDCHKLLFRAPRNRQICSKYSSIRTWKIELWTKLKLSMVKPVKLRLGLDSMLVKSITFINIWSLWRFWSVRNKTWNLLFQKKKYISSMSMMWEYSMLRIVSNRIFNLIQDRYSRVFLPIRGTE